MKGERKEEEEEDEEEEGLMGEFRFWNLEKKKKSCGRSVIRVTRSLEAADGVTVPSKVHRRDTLFSPVHSLTVNHEFARKQSSMMQPSPSHSAWTIDRVTTSV